MNILDNKLISCLLGIFLIFAGISSFAIDNKISQCDKALRFSSAEDFNGKYLLTVQSNNAYLWDVKSGTELQRFTGHDEPIYAVAISPDGRQILTASGRGGDASVTSTDNSIRLWNVKSGNETMVFQGGAGYYRNIQFSPNGKQILFSGDEPVQLFDAKSGALLLTLPEMEGATFSPDGRSILGLQHSRITIWKATDGSEICHIAVNDAKESFFNYASFSSGGKKIVTASGDKTARIWDATTGKQIRMLVGHADPVSQALFIVNDKEIITASADDTIRLWDAKTGREITRFQIPSSPSRIAVSNDGKRLMVNFLKSSDSQAERCTALWNLESQQMLMQLTNTFDSEQIVGFSPDDETFILSKKDKPAVLCDGRNGKIIREY